MASAEWHWEQGVKYAIEGIKTSLLLNGVAAISLMTFVSHKTLSWYIIVALVLFALGAMTSAVTFLAAYKTQLEYGNAEVGLEINLNDKERKYEVWSKGIYWNGWCIGLVFLSIFFFFTGIMFTAAALLHQN